MEQSIVIYVDPEKVKDYHRGDVCDMDFGYDGKVERHKVRIVSKYRLRNGESRVKLVSFQQSVLPTNDGLTHADNESKPAVISG